ncbi:signal recognition particle, SRP9/SRP14 subunit [Hyaloscypha variabilis F]|uniref:Signal recognition particle subunit SRP14 n=1 Tax=Hyaloscypha variabilis (strain UAMH 11265 / GT02V1 / F) TaxID=1149755 RepID=A0A2J6RVN2_HYAVF|nr:signal recognition particle, SRP9/SRP14 subunit [Hyaloscypha variabilis F]
MSTGHLSNDDFFLRLSELFDERRRKDHGSIHLTQKRMSYGEDTDLETSEPTIEQPFPDLSPSKPFPIIIRATNGKSKDRRDKKIKLSTIVEGGALDGFFAKYAEVCKLGMSGLKKRDRSKQKEKLKAKKKKQGGGAMVSEVKKG